METFAWKCPDPRGDSGPKCYQPKTDVQLDKNVYCTLKKSKETFDSVFEKSSKKAGEVNFLH